MAEHAGAAMRRRQRRLRQWLRHERLSVAMALAETNHHAAPRGQTKARAGREARDALHGHVREAPLPQGRVLRHVVGHLPVPALDVPVPQMVDQLPDVEQSERLVRVAELLGSSLLLASELAPFCVAPPAWGLREEEEGEEEEEEEEEEASSSNLFLLASSSSPAVAYAGLVLLVPFLRSFPFVWRQAQAAKLHGWYGQDGQFHCSPSFPAVAGGSCLFCTSRCVSFPVVRPKMPCIMAGMDQKYSYVRACIVCW